MALVYLCPPPLIQTTSMSSKICREDLLVLLASIGVSLPTNTKISEEDLNKRLTQALDAAQQFRTVIESTPFNPSTFPTWPLEKNLPEATVRLGIMDGVKMKLSHGPKVSADKKDTFKEIRTAVMSFAHGIQAGQREFWLTDQLGKFEGWGIYARVRVVLLRFSQKTLPLFVVLYKELHPVASSSIQDAVEALLTSTNTGVLTGIQTTELERLTMLKLFRMNTKRLTGDFYPEDSKARSQGLKPSFLLPLGPLTMREMGKLTTDTGCEVCGKKNISRCLQCLSVAYCSPECQKHDWPNHKPTCRSLKGGTWHTVTFDTPETPHGAGVVIMNRLDTIDEVKAKGQIAPTKKGVPPDVHEGKIFLVKFQISLFQFKDEANFLLYDRQRSFQVMWWRKDDRDLFDEAEEALADELKMYRWARRVGDYQLSVCLDRAPAQKPVW
ncbi:hypothetical protein GALMADRAFT_61129 [Galerina marginata CBS 339.88]|uniref:MYND-type domain-containing protein n=1 Tax=Galerina marginata (strain CBS 339.88) TaxID=685588 RepID=A0A067TM77_GALM3|nr:hypothetical protein GALMADRAFT_61129 [Galerina marginata CBS 339.88]